MGPWSIPGCLGGPWGPRGKPRGIRGVPGAFGVSLWASGGTFGALGGSEWA